MLASGRHAIASLFGLRNMVGPADQPEEALSPPASSSPDDDSRATPSLDELVAQEFSPSELAGLADIAPDIGTTTRLDGADYDGTTLRLLQSLVVARLATATPPGPIATLSAADFAVWHRRQHLLSCIARETGQLDDSQRHALLMMEEYLKRASGERDLAALGELRLTLLRAGDLRQAEWAAREALYRPPPAGGDRRPDEAEGDSETGSEWSDELLTLPASPAGLETARALMQIIALQGRYDEACELGERAYAAIRDMETHAGPLADRAPDERHKLDDVTSRLRGWSDAAGE